MLLPGQETPEQNMPKPSPAPVPRNEKTVPPEKEKR